MEIPILNPSLEILQISGNKISDISRISDMKNLTHLELNDNKISDIPNAIGQLQELLVLGLGANELTELPDSCRCLWSNIK